ncbi:transcriptional repressor [Thermodesulfovibrionales bacterium]|nr:transcriptional repressor [Thermodesulfovibrionales bacterium]
MGRQKFKEFLVSKSLKLTREREEILDEIYSAKGHFDPEELSIRLKAKGSKASRASVYRTIPLLIEGGFIEKVEMVDRHAHYERVSEKQHHDHLICIKCGKIIEFHSPVLEMLQDEICQKETFKGIRHTLEIMGYCEGCNS